jgi:predicted kinase
LCPRVFPFDSLRQAQSTAARGRPFVGNATNLISKQRQSLVELFTDYAARVRIVYLEVPIDRAWQQNKDQQ